MKKNTYYRMAGGFTLVEVMVAMVVLAIGLLGMAGMTLMVIRGGTQASHMTYATNLASDKMESLKSLNYDNLASEAGTCDTTNAAALLNGCDLQRIMNEPGLNQQGSTSGGGPYPFTRRWVICISGTTENPTDNNCSNDSCDTTRRPVELSCNRSVCDAVTGEVQPSEKKLKVMVVWRDRAGKCHEVNMESIQVQ
jgi:prepilin-type N-terminal cleavage/methylation domain-containing protein